LAQAKPVLSYCLKHTVLYFTLERDRLDLPPVILKFSYIESLTLSTNNSALVARALTLAGRAIEG